MNRYIIYALTSLMLCLSVEEGMCKGGLLSKMKKKKPAKTEAKAPEKKTSDYDKLFKDKKVRSEAKGIMNLYNVEGKLLVEIPAKMFERDMMLISSVTEISDHTDCYVGQAPYRPLQVKFSKIGNKVHLRRDRSQSVVSGGDRQVQAALDQSNIPAIMTSFEIKAYTPDSSAVVVDMTDFFTGDQSLLSPINYRSESKLLMMGVSYRHSKDKSFLDEVKAFDNNVSVFSYLTYDSSYRDFYRKSTTARMERTLALLPEVPMRPRIADYRLPLNVIGKYNYKSDYKVMDAVYYATRWRLEPKDQAAYDRGEAVEPVKPITFYMDTVFTQLLKNSITEGILEWNKCFEAIGFKNAIQVKPFPSKKEDPNFDPENYNYSCIRYVPTLAGGASVRTYTDPRSGEILRTTITVCHNFVYEKPFEIFVFTAHADPAVRQRYIPDSTMHEHFKNYFTWLTGIDCFGMSYNLTASAAYTTDSLRNAEFTQKYGTTPSMLDLAFYNFVAPIDAVKKGFRITPKGVGVYDYHIVKCLYKPIPEAKTPEEELKVIEGWIDEHVGDPVYRYENAKDCPDCGANDVGDDDLKNFKYGIENLKYCLDNFEKWITDEDDPEYRYRRGIYQLLNRRFNQLITQVAITAYGIKTYERKAGDPVPPFEYTSRERQLAALDILYDNRYLPDWLTREDLDTKMDLARDRRESFKDYIMLLMHATGGRLFAYEDKGDHIGHTEYMKYMYNKLFEKTRKGEELRDEDYYYQTKFFQTMVASSKVVDRKAKYKAANKVGIAIMDSAEDMNDMSVMDYSNPEACLKKIENCDRILYDMVTMNDPDLISGNYGRLKRWPLMNLQVSRMTYYDILKDIQKLVRTRVNTGSAKTQQHYRYILDTVNRLLD